MKNHIYIVAFWLTLTGIIFFSLLPYLPIKASVQIDEKIIRLDYLCHFLGYAILTWLLSKTYKLNFNNVLGLLLFSILSEGLQLFVEGRTVNPMDVASNIIGVLCTMVLIVYVNSQRGFPK